MFQAQCFQLVASVQVFVQNGTKYHAYGLLSKFSFQAFVPRSLWLWNHTSITSFSTEGCTKTSASGPLQTRQAWPLCFTLFSVQCRPKWSVFIGKASPGWSEAFTRLTKIQGCIQLMTLLSRRKGIMWLKVVSMKNGVGTLRYLDKRIPDTFTPTSKARFFHFAFLHGY